MISLQHPTTLALPLFRSRQPERGNDSLEIVISVIFDFDPAALFSGVNRHMGPEMLLQPILQIFDYS